MSAWNREPMMPTFTFSATFMLPRSHHLRNPGNQRGKIRPPLGVRPAHLPGDLRAGPACRALACAIWHRGRDWLRDLCICVAGDWGYDFLKIDFVRWTLLSADRYHDPAFSKAAAYRKRFEIIRDAVGVTCQILDWLARWHRLLVASDMPQARAAASIIALFGGA